MRMSGTLVECARGEALMGRRSWSAQRVDCRTCLLVDCSRGSWVSQLGVALLSHPLMLRSSVRLLLPASAQPTPPSARVFPMLMVSRGSFDDPIRGIFGRAVLVTEDDVFLGDMGVHSRSGWSRIPMLQTTRLFSGTIAGFACTRCSVAPNGFRRLGVTGLVLLNTTEPRCWKPCFGR